MTIRATVKFEKFDINQAWELMEGEGEHQPFLVFTRLEDGSSLVIPLDQRHIRDIGVLHGADKNYVGPLNISDVQRKAKHNER